MCVHIYVYSCAYGVVHVGVYMCVPRLVHINLYLCAYVCDVHMKAYVRMCVCVYLGWYIYVYMHMEASGQFQLLFVRTHPQILITK